MALRLKIIPEKSAFRAAGDLQVAIEVSNCSDIHAKVPFSVDISDLSVACISTERIDRSWIAAAYGSQVPPREKVNRHETREVMRAGPQNLAPKFKLLPSQQRQWQIRMELPEWLPPSFKGSAARFAFHVVASLKFSSSPAGMKLLTQHLSLDPKSRVSRGSLLTIPNKKGSKGKLLQEPVAEQIASATLPILIHPHQVSGREPNSFADKKPLSADANGLATGDDAELLPIIYSHNSKPAPSIHVQEILKPRTSLSIQHSGEMNGSHARRNGMLPPLAPNHPPKTPQTPPTTLLSPWASGPVTEMPNATPVSQTQGGFQAASLRPARHISTSPGFQSGAGATTPMTAVPSEAILRTFNLRLSDHLLARVTLQPPADRELCLGSTLCGTVDFRQSQQTSAQDPSAPKCVQLVVVLETEECIESQWNAASPSTQTSGIRQVQDEVQELTSDMLLTHFLLSLPKSAPASFSTHLVSLQWMLRFEFATMSETASTGWLGGSSRKVDRLIWNLPILVRPG